MIFVDKEIEYENGIPIREIEEPPSELQEEFKTFFSHYEIDDVIFHPQKKPSLGPKNQRVCRFCGKATPEVSFNKVAHTIAQLTGNRNLVSNFECDTCNEYFSILENEFARMIGISRTLTNLKGQDGLPKFRTPDKNFEVGVNKETSRLEMISEGLENKHFEIDEEKKQLTIYSTKHPYKPVAVFKVLLKIALCYIDTNELKHFRTGFKVIMSESLDDKLVNFPMLRTYKHTFGGARLKYPLIFKMKKREDAPNPNCPKYCFILYFGNYIFQFFLPFYEPDKEVIKVTGTVFLPPCPPLLGKTYFTINPIPKRRTIDLSQNTPVKNEQDIIVMNFENLKYTYPEVKEPSATKEK